MSASPDPDYADALRWLSQAEQQFEVGEYNRAGGYSPAACFFFQQAGELALKALLVRHGVRERVHTVAHLVARLAKLNESVADLEAAARDLDRFYVTTRYPDSLPSGTSRDHFIPEDAESAQNAARSILERVRQLLPSFES